MNGIVSIVLFALLLTPLIHLAGAATCSSNEYLTLYSNNADNSTVGIDNITARAYMAKFVYSNASKQCVFQGIPNQNITFYLTSLSYSSHYFDQLYTLGSAFTNSTGNSILSYNSSLIGPGSFTLIARWYTNNSAPTIQSNNASLVLSKPTGTLWINCTSGCGNVSVGQKFTLVSYLCVGRPPFSIDTCEYLPNQTILFNASSKYLGSGNTNSSGGATITYNTVLLGVGSYDVYAVWAGGARYAGLNLSSDSGTHNLNVFAAPKSTSTSSVSATSTTAASSTTSTSTPITTYIVVLAVIIVLAVAAKYWSSHKTKHGK